MTKIWIAALVLALLPGVTGAGATMAWATPTGTPAAGFGQDRGGWDRPSAGLRGMERQGFQDGIEGARKDFGNHRQPNVNNREEYLRPNLPRGEWRTYQRGFQRGYQQAAAHLWGGGGPADGPMMGGPGRQMGDQGAPMRGPDGDNRDNRGDNRGDSRGMGRGMDRGVMQGPARDTWQRGFQEGMEGALKDFGNNRRLDVDNREEYRNSSLPYELQEPYRSGFRRGYQAGAQELTSGGSGRGAGPMADVRQRGFQDGMEGALRDFGNHRQPNPDNRDEYRHPDAPPQAWGPYREGFRRGYQLAMKQLLGMPVGR